MHALLIVAAVTGWGGFLVLLALRRAARRALARRESTVVGERPDFARLAEMADADDMPDSARMYRTMDATWPADKEPTVRTDPGEEYTPVPRIDREDVEDVHGVACYRDFNMPADRKRDYREPIDLGSEHPLAGRCICHHAIWHSCPDPGVGRRIMSSLPSRGMKIDQQREDRQTDLLQLGIDRLRTVGTARGLALADEIERGRARQNP